MKALRLCAILLLAAQPILAADVAPVLHPNEEWETRWLIWVNESPYGHDFNMNYIPRCTEYEP